MSKATDFGGVAVQHRRPILAPNPRKSPNSQTRELNLARSHRVLCSPAPIRGVGSSVRTLNTPSAVFTLGPAYHRATKALASVESRK